MIEALCNIFPDADIFTHVYVPSAISDTIRRHKITSSFIGSLPRARHMYKKYLPLMPMALEQLDLRGYDLIISSESGPAKGIIPPPASVHICYCHSPMRYLWNMFHEYRESSGPLTKFLMPPLAHYLRNWDVISSVRVDHYVSNSRTVADRIQRYYRRESEIIAPPVDVDAFEIAADHEIGDYYLLAGELVAYKRPDLAINAFNAMKEKLVVIGGGEMLDHIKRIAGPTITVMGPQPFDVLRHHYARCKALIFPGEEDFGIVPVEAMASGRPVIAYGRGGATETVVPNLSGIFFEEQNIDAIIAAERQLRAQRFDPHKIAAHAQQFSAIQFSNKMKAHIEEVMAARSKGNKLH